MKAHGIEYKSGWLNINRVQLPYDNISSVDTDVSILGKLLGYGTIMVQANNSNVNVQFKSINEPDQIKQLIEEGITREHGTFGFAQPTIQVGVADEILKLQQLKDSGTITSEEFDSEKSRLLSH
jgi:selenophosphate synthase